MFNDSITGCIRHGEKEATVTLDLPDLTYTWEKGENKNGYSITTKEGTKEYSRVGFQVPDEIPNYGFREFRLDGEAQPIRPQFAEWHNPIFLLNKSGKVITELMASVTRLDVINMSIRKCSASLRHDKSTLKVREGDQKKAKRRSLEFDVLDAIEVQSIDQLCQQCTVLEQGLKEIDSYILKKDTLERSIASLALVDSISIPDVLPHDFDREVRDIDSYIQKVDAFQNRLSKLHGLDSVALPDPLPLTDLSLLTQLSSWSLKVDQYQTKLDAMSVLDAVVVPPSDFGTLTESIVLVEGWLKTVGICGNDLKAANAELANITKQVSQDEALLGTLRGQLETCPVCGRVGHE